MKLPILLLTLTVAACGSKSPTSPSTTPPPTTTQTRVISLEGTLDFGAIQINQSFSATLRIHNSGTAQLTVTSLTGPNTANFSASWTSGTIPAGSSQAVTIRFSPTAPQSYGGTLTVNADHTSGTNTIQIAGRGSLDGIPIFTRSGTGDTVIDGMPSYVTRVRVIGTYTRNSSNFVVRVNGRLLVNELLGTGWGTTRYDGTLLLPAGAGTIEITISSGVVWSITEVR